MTEKQHSRMWQLAIMLPCIILKYAMATMLRSKIRGGKGAATEPRRPRRHDKAVV
jgi:hypothetical protein